MTLTNFLAGVPVMVICLILQVGVVYWCVRYCTRYSRSAAAKGDVPGAIRPLVVSMMAMMVVNLLQIVLWGGLFLGLGEFEDVYLAIYHSGVNFTSLGYGDVVMKEQWKLLGPLEAANGILMMSMSAAALTAILQHVIRVQSDVVVVERRRSGESID